MLKEYVIHKEWVDKNDTILSIGSVEGKWHKILNSKKEDRLFFIMINQDINNVFFIEHHQQIELMSLILKNDIIERRFFENCEKFEKAINKCKEEWNRGGIES